MMLYSNIPFVKEWEMNYAQINGLCELSAVMQKIASYAQNYVCA